MDEEAKPKARRPVKKPQGDASGHDHKGNQFGPMPVNRRLSRGEQQATRLAAEIYYTLDLGGVSVAQMAAMPQFSGVGAQTMSAWARAGDWESKRQDNRLRWADELKRKLSDQLIHHQYEEMMQLKAMHDQAYSYAMPAEDGTLPAPPRNFAEAAKVYIQLDQALGARRERILEGVGLAADNVQKTQSPAADGGGRPAQVADAPILPKMTQDEYQELAHHMMSLGFEDGPSAKLPEVESIEEEASVELPEDLDRPDDVGD